MSEQPEAAPQMAAAAHFAVPVFDKSDEPVKPYECQRCGHPIQPNAGAGWAHDESSPAPSSKGHGGG